MKKALGLILCFTLAYGGCGVGPDRSGTSGASGDIKSVNHIILFMQENRSFDHYFGKLNDYRARVGLPQDVDGLPANLAPQPTWDGTPGVAPFKMQSTCSDDLSSSWVESRVDLNYTSMNNPGTPPPMNGFAYTAGGFCEHNGCADISGARAMGYYTEEDLPFYYWLASQFAISDKWFSAAPSRTQPNRMYFLAATSQGFAYPPTEPLTAKTIFQLLQENGITWKVYVRNNWQQGGTGDTYMNYFTNFTPQHIDKFAPVEQYFTDVANGTLPQVALIESGYESGEDEHPLNPIDRGAEFSRQLITALMNSPSWKDSVFFLTYDEGGGLYDHVPPIQTVNPDDIPPKDLLPTDPQGDFTISGFRVPLVVISPFTRKGYVSHTPADFTALLKFIEERFGLPSLTKRDGAQPSMREYFNFDTAPNLNPGNPPAQPVDINRCRFTLP